MTDHEKALIRQALDIVEAAAPSIAGVFLGPHAAEAARDIIAIADSVSDSTPRPAHPALGVKGGAERIAGAVGGIAAVKRHVNDQLVAAKERHALDSIAPPPGPPVRTGAYNPQK